MALNLDIPDAEGRLAVAPKMARRMLSIGLTQLYELLNSGELSSLRVGRSRRILVASIHAYVGKLIAQSRPPSKSPTPRPVTPRRDGDAEAPSVIISEGRRWSRQPMYRQCGR